MTDEIVLHALAPVIVLLALSVFAVVASRAVALSPIVGYLVLGIALKASGLALFADSHTVTVLHGSAVYTH
jgi:Kef-type K+ transport system membrane component KefB